MKKTLLLLAIVLIANVLQSQVAPGKYWVQFVDKQNNPYSIDYPEAYLSVRALQRRANQHIAIDEHDLPVTPDYLKSLSQAGALVLNVSKWLNGAVVEVTDTEVIQQIEQLPFVGGTRRCADGNFTKIADDGMDFVPSFYGDAFDHIGTINGKPLHDAGFMGQGMLIAVIDGGFRGADTIKVLASLRDEGRLLGTRNFVERDSTVFKGSQHGTACLGLMAGYLPNEYVGTAPKASFYLFVTEDVSSENIIEEYNWVSAAELADSLGVDVCSTSLGYVDFDDAEQTHVYEDLDGATTPVSRGAAIACSRGMLCVNSAGNSGQNPFPYIGAPADVEAVLTVGAVNGTGELAPFSSVGPTFDQRIKPDVVAMGVGDKVAAYNGTYYNGSGTSYSCPVVAGMSACLWQSRPLATPRELADALRQTANRSDMPDCSYGYGLPDFAAAMALLPETVDYESDSLIIVFPNPSTGNVRLRLLDATKVTIVVNDVLGRGLFECEFNGLNNSYLEYKLNSLGAGVYLVTASTASHSQTVKLVRLR